MSGAGDGWGPLDLERLDAAQLLGRPEATLALTPALTWLRGRRVLVTGAGGSVGRALAARLSAVDPAALVLLDSHEASLFHLHRRLAAGPRPPLPVLGDVRNRARLASVLRQHRPEVVFHLAAYKHVHFGEAQPDESIAVNVLATRALAELAAEHGAAALVYSSSDKAVRPSGAYGATKRLAELAVHGAGAGAAGRFVVVRFVNVLGTRGSVLETWAEQLREGRPLQVTDAAMTRYWMSMREAVDLLLLAAGVGEGGSTLLLDTGEPQAVPAVARRLSASLGHGASPALEFVGSRPGERLAEELASAREQLLAGPAPGVWRVARRGGDAPLAAGRAAIDELARAVEDDEPGLAARLVALARELG